MPRSRVALLIGYLVFVAAIASAYLMEHRSTPPHAKGWILLAMLGTFGLLFGSLAAVGTFLGLRGAAPGRLSYKTGIAIAVIYFAFILLDNQIPVDPSLIFPEGRTSDLPVYLRGGLLVLLMGGVVPYLIALVWRLTIGSSDRGNHSR